MRKEQGERKMEQGEKLNTYFAPDIPYLRELALNNNPLQKIDGHAFEKVRRAWDSDLTSFNLNFWKHHVKKQF